MSETPLSDDSNLLRHSDILSEWLGESHLIALIINETADCLAMLARKRATLEEKIIAKELHTLVASYGRMLSAIHTTLAGGGAPQEETLESVRSFNYDVRAAIAKLLKALTYNLNYVEQYFEYDFSSKLSRQWRFAEMAEELVQRLQK